MWHCNLCLCFNLICSHFFLLFTLKCTICHFLQLFCLCRAEIWVNSAYTSGFSFSLWNSLFSGWSHKDGISQWLLEFQFYYLLLPLKCGVSFLFFILYAGSEPSYIHIFCCFCYIWKPSLFFVIAELRYLSLSCFCMVPYLFSILLANSLVCRQHNKKKNLHDAGQVIPISVVVLCFIIFLRCFPKCSKYQSPCCLDWAVFRVQCCLRVLLNPRPCYPLFASLLIFHSFSFLKNGKKEQDVFFYCLLHLVAKKTWARVSLSCSFAPRNLFLLFNSLKPDNPWTKW